MAGKRDQILTQIGITLLITLAFLVAWVFFLEDMIIGTLLGESLVKTQIQQWEFVLAGLLLVGISLILPVRKLIESQKNLHQAEMALQGERTLSQVFFSVDNSILIVTDTSHRVSQINQKTTQILGYREGELLGKEWIQTLVGENSRALVKKNVQSLLNDRTKQAITYTVSVMCKDRTERIVEWQASPLTDERGMVYGTINSGIDITESRRLKKELRTTLDRYEPQLKKMAADLMENKKKLQGETAKNLSSRSKFQFWMDMDTILLSMTEDQKNNPLELDGRVRLIIQRYGEMTGVDSGYVFLFDEQGNEMSNTHIWSLSDPDLQPAPEEKIPLDTFPWFQKKIKNLEIIHAKKLAELPEEASAEKEIFQSQGIKSLINVPLVINKKPIGYIGFESMTKEKAWDPDEISMLRVMSKILTQLLEPRVTTEESEGVTISPEDAQAEEKRLEDMKQNYEEQLKNQRTAIGELEKARANLQKELDAQNETKSEISRDQESLKEQLEAQNNTMEELQSQLERELQEKNLLMEQLESVQGQIDTQKQEADRLAQELESARNEISEKENALIEQAETATSSDEVDNLKQLHTEKLESLHQEQVQLQKNLDTLESDLREKEELVETLNTRLDSESQSKQDIESQMEEVTQSLKRQSQEYKALEMAHSMLQGELDELKNVQQDYDATKNAFEEKEKSFGDIQKELEQELAEHKGLVERLKVHQHRMEHLGLPLIEINASGRISQINRAAEMELGILDDEVHGKPLTVLSGKADEEFDLENSLIAPLRDQSKHEIDLELKTARGDSFPARLSFSSLLDDQGMLEGAIGYLVPAPASTDQLKQEEMAEPNFEEVAQHAGILTMKLASDFKVLDLSQQVTHLFGWERKDVFEKNFFNLVVPEEQSQEIQDDVLDVLQSKSSSDFECESRIQGNENRSIWWNIVRQEYDQERPTSYLAIGQDLTSLRHAEKSLKENEGLLHTVIDSSTDGFITIDEAGIIQSFNPGAESIFGYGHNEVIGQNVNLLMPEPYRGEHTNYINNYLISGKAKVVGMAPREFVAQKKDGSTFPVEVAVREMYQDYRRLFVGVVRDITRRKTIEQTLKESEEKFRKVLAAETDAVVILNANTKRILETNDAAVAMFGYDKEEILRLKVTDICSEPEKNFVAGNGSALGHISRTPRRYHKKKDGTIFPAQVSVATFMVQNQKLHIRVMRDLTEQVKIEENLRENQEHLNHILNQTPAAVYLKDADGRYSMINKQFENLFHVTQERVLGKTDHEVFPKDLADEFDQADQKVLEQGSTLETQETILYSDGAHIFDTVKFPLRNSSGVLYGLCGVLSDITQRIRLEEELTTIRNNVDELVIKRTEDLQKLQQRVVRTEKLKATSQLASAVAQQINNPIHGIRNILEQVSARVPMEEIHKSLVDVAIGECGRVSTLLDKLDECHAPKVAEAEALDLNQVIEEAITGNQEKLGDLISIEKHFAHDLPQVKGSTTQIRHAIEQLIQNAEEALPEHKGKILIATERERNNIKIHIQDTGCGIPPENIEMIFDPFFTTKTALKRSGLGLLVTMGIVKGHQGDIEVKSQPGKGTTFTITLPVK